MNCKRCNGIKPAFIDVLCKSISQSPRKVYQCNKCGRRYINVRSSIKNYLELHNALAYTQVIEIGLVYWIIYLMGWKGIIIIFAYLALLSILNIASYPMREFEEVKGEVCEHCFFTKIPYLLCFANLLARKKQIRCRYCGTTFNIVYDRRSWWEFLTKDMPMIFAGLLIIPIRATIFIGFIYVDWIFALLWIVLTIPLLRYEHTKWIPLNAVKEVL